MRPFTLDHALSSAPLQLVQKKRILVVHFGDEGSWTSLPYRRRREAPEIHRWHQGPGIVFHGRKLHFLPWSPVGNWDHRESSKTQKKAEIMEEISTFPLDFITFFYSLHEWWKSKFWMILDNLDEWNDELWMYKKIKLLMNICITNDNVNELGWMPYMVYGWKFVDENFGWIFWMNFGWISGEFWMNFLDEFWVNLGWIFLDETFGMNILDKYTKFKMK